MRTFGLMVFALAIVACLAGTSLAGGHKAPVKAIVVPQKQKAFIVLEEKKAPAVRLEFRSYTPPATILQLEDGCNYTGQALLLQQGYSGQPLQFRQRGLSLQLQGFRGYR